jgi:hypothetical protein
MSGSARLDPNESPASRRTRRLMTTVLGVVVAFGGLAFVYKLYEFFMDLSASSGLRFAGAHLLTYVLVAGGFLCLLAFAFLRGHFGEIEAAKYELLDQEVRRDREDFHG